jgi:hypothetical protein
MTQCSAQHGGPALSAWELACHASPTTVFAAERLFVLSVSVRYRPPSDRAIGHAPGTLAVVSSSRRQSDTHIASPVPACTRLITVHWSPPASVQDRMGLSLSLSLRPDARSVLYQAGIAALGVCAVLAKANSPEIRERERNELEQEQEHAQRG